MFYILVAFVCTCASLLLYPYLLYPVSLALISRWFPVDVVSAGEYKAFSFSLVTCVRNERQVIGEKVANLLQIRTKLQNCEILIYDDASTDGSREFLENCSSEVKLIKAARQTGKTGGVNELIAHCVGEIVVFSDANVAIEESSVASLSTYFSDPSVGCVSGTLHYTNAKESETAFVGAVYRNLEEWLKGIETRTGTVVFTDGTLFAVRRELLTEVPPDLTDDFFIGLNVICRGFRIIAAPEFVAYERASTKSSDEFWRRVRIGCNSFSCHLYMWPQIKRLDALTIYKYIAHKFIRWMSSYILAVLLFCIFLLAVETTNVGIALFLFAIVVVSAFVSRVFRLAGLYQFVDALGAIVATGYGVFLAIRGHRYHVWKVSESSRNGST